MAHAGEEGRDNLAERRKETGNERRVTLAGFRAPGLVKACPEFARQCRTLL